MKKIFILILIILSWSCTARYNENVEYTEAKIELSKYDIDIDNLNLYMNFLILNSDKIYLDSTSKIVAEGDTNSLSIYFKGTQKGFNLLKEKLKIMNNKKYELNLIYFVNQPLKSYGILRDELRMTYLNYNIFDEILRNTEWCKILFIVEREKLIVYRIYYNGESDTDLIH